MKITLLLIVAFFLFMGTGYSQKLDPAYINTFGEGTIIASIGGYPKLDTYEPAQFNFRDSKFFILGDKESTLNFRLIYPKGMTEGKFLDKLKKEKPQNLKHKKSEYGVWQLWISHETSGSENLTERTPWPQKLTDLPKWSEPYCEKYYNASAESKNWSTSGWPWTDGLQGTIGHWLEYSKPGYKMYIVYRICYEYSVPGGQIENKWDDVLKKFVPTRSTGGIGYVYSDPIAACTIEVFGEDISDDRFKDNGNGTVTDSKTNLIWEKEPYKKGMFWNEAVTFAKECKVGNYSDWRLPTAKELEDMMKISKAKDEGYTCVWLNEHGFSGIEEESYWTSTPYILNGESTDQKIGVDFRYKTVGGSDINYMKNVWLVRSAN